MAWTIDSPLWGALAKYSSQEIPSSRSVALTTFNSRQEMQFYQGNQMSGGTFTSRYSSSPMKAYDQRGLPLKRRYENEYEEVEGDGNNELIQPRTKRNVPEDFPEDFTTNEPSSISVEKELPSSITLFFRKVKNIFIDFTEKKVYRKIILRLKFFFRKFFKSCHCER